MVQPMTVADRQIEEHMQYQNQTLLHYVIHYPRLSSTVFPQTARLLNQHFEQKAREHEKYFREHLFTDAKDQYNYAKSAGYPIRAYEALVTYTVTYNLGCVFSLYFDQYEFTGGAHGNTVRHAENWELVQPTLMPLSSLFPPGTDYERRILAAIQQRIQAQASSDPIFFPDYAKLIKQYFESSQYYLVPDGMYIFYQLYQIAPYVLGIPTFQIPMNAVGAAIPPCRQGRHI